MPTREQQLRLIDLMYPAAKRFEAQTGIPAAWTIAMSVNESGWDPSQKRTWFGIVDPQGEMMDTWEADASGKPYNTRRAFAVDTNPDDAYKRLGASLTKYRDAPKDSPYSFARYLRTGIKGAMWATDPDYEKKIARLADEVEGMLPEASQAGDSKMPDPTTNPWEEDAEYRGYKEAYTREIEATLQALQEERDALLKSYNEWTMQSYSEAQYAQLDLLQQRVGALDTLIRQTRAALASASSKAIDKWLSSQQQRLSNAIAMGNLTQKQVEFEWGKLMDQANTGINGLIQGYASLRAALPQMGTQSMADAAKALMLNWRQLGVNIPDFELRVQEYDPLDEIRKRLPPAVDWQQAIAGGGGGAMVIAAPAPAQAPAPAPAAAATPGARLEIPESLAAEPWGQSVPTPWQQGLLGSSRPSVLPPIRRGGGFPEGAPGAPSPITGPGALPPQYGPALPPGFTPGPSGVPGPTPAPSPTPAAGQSGKLTPAQQTALDAWRKRNPKATMAQQEAARQAILEGLLR